MMKIMKKISKRFIAVLCVATVLCSVVPANKLERVQATDTSTEKTVMVQKLTEGTVTPGQGTTEYSMDGYVFGGYYDNYDENAEKEKFRTPITGEAREASAEDPIYIKWIPKEVMNVKAQVRQDEYKKILASCDSKDESSNILAKYDFDSETSISTSGGVETADINYIREGAGALRRERTTKEVGQSLTYFDVLLSDSVDVRGYKYFSCKLFLGESDMQHSENHAGTAITAYDSLPDEGDVLTITLSSEYGETKSGVLQFKLSKSELTEGWNDLRLTFAEAETVCNSTSNGVYSGAAIKYVQIAAKAGDTLGSFWLYLDDICVLNENPGMLLFDGDQMENRFAKVEQGGANADSSAITSTLLTDKTQIQEGAGAIKAVSYLRSNNNGEYRMQFNAVMTNANKYDISSYMTTGSLHLWLYIHHANDLQSDVTVYLSSDGNTMKKTATHTVNRTDLHEGWNELYLPLKAFTVKTDDTAFIDTAVNGIRVHCGKAATADTYADQYMIVDDVRIVDNVLWVTDCDSIGDITFNSKNVSVTKNAKQGGGAFEYTRQNSTVKTLLQMKLPSPVDFTSHKEKNGCLHFWMYLSDLSGLGANLHVDIDSSSGGSTKTRYSIPVTHLQTGWNEMYLNLDRSSSSGNTNWSEIVLMQIVTGLAGDCTIRLDDITLVPGTKETAAVRFVSTVDSLNYKNVGFTIKQSYSKNALVTETTTVYKEFYAIGKTGQPDTFGPSDVSGISCSDYMYGATVVNLPNRLWNAVFTVTPYWVTQDGTTVTGSAQTYTINQLMNATRQLLTNATE